MNQRALSGSRLSSSGWALVGVLVALVMVVLTWLFVVGPTRADADDLRTSAADVGTQNAALSSTVSNLRTTAADRGALADQVQAALAGLPSGTSLPVFGRQLADQATREGVTLTAFSVGTPNVPGTTGAATSTTTRTASELAIPVTVMSTGPALQQLRFLRDIQQVGPRLALVTTSTLAPGSGEGADQSDITVGSTMTLQLTVFTHRLPTATRTQLGDLLTAPAS